MKRNGTMSAFEVEFKSRYEKEWSKKFHGMPAIDLGLFKLDMETAMEIDKRKKKKTARNKKKGK